MNWATHDHVPVRRVPPAPMLLETFWRMASPNGRKRILTCSLFQIANLYDVRVGYSEFDFVKTTIVPSVAEGRELAEHWKQTVVGMGFTAPKE